MYFVYDLSNWVCMCEGGGWVYFDVLCDLVKPVCIMLKESCSAYSSVSLTPV